MLRQVVKKAALGSAVAALAFAALPATNAFAINRSSPCPRSDYAEIENQGWLCWANAGSAAVYVTDVYLVHAGNNNVIYAKPGQADTYLPRNVQDVYPSRNVTVTRIQIL